MHRLVLIRHGETPWNADKVLQGQADIGLSERGHAQARSLAPLLHAYQPTLVVSSDLARARQTAAALGHADAVTDPLWREADLGEWTSCRAAEVMARDAEHYQRWRDGLDSPPGGETVAQFRGRVAQALEPLNGHAGTVAVVTHGGVIRAVLVLLLGLSAERLVAVAPGSLSALQMAPTPRLLAYNHAPPESDAALTD